MNFLSDPLFILLAGVLTVVGMIVVLRANAFLSLLAAALVVRFMTPIPDGAVPGWDIKVQDVCTAFGEMAGKIGILIAMGAIIGKCMLDSGAADRIIRAIFRLFGEKLVPAALLSSGLILSIPVFYDATFYLLVPIARSVYRRVKKNYLLYLMAIGLGATLSHTLIPPTPGPVAVAETLGIPLGSMMIVSLLVGFCTAPFALGIAFLMNWFKPNPEIHFGDESVNAPENLEQERSQTDDPAKNVEPSLFWAFAPIAVPVVLIAVQTTIEMLEKTKAITWSENGLVLRNLCRLLGDPRFALIIAAVIGMGVLFAVKKLSLTELGKRVETALIGAGMIILITSAGGAFGEMLRKAEIGDRIKAVFQNDQSETALTGVSLLLLAFGIATLIKCAQGSSTTAIITTAGIFTGILSSQGTADLPFNAAYIAVAIGLGSCVTGWMNDSGFWIFCRMGGIKETDALQTWTVGLVLLGLSGLLVVLVLSQILPLTSLPGIETIPGAATID